MRSVKTYHCEHYEIISYTLTQRRHFCYNPLMVDIDQREQSLAAQRSRLAGLQVGHNNELVTYGVAESARNIARRKFGEGIISGDQGGSPLYTVSKDLDGEGTGGARLYVNLMVGGDRRWQVEVGTVVNGRAVNTFGLGGIEAFRVWEMIKDLEKRRKSGELADLNATCNRIGD